MKKKYYKKAIIREELIETMTGVFYIMVISAMAGTIGWLLAVIYLKPDLC